MSANRWIQLYTPDSMRGPVGAVSSLFISASNELGEAESGFLVAIIGRSPRSSLEPVGGISYVGIWAWRFPSSGLPPASTPPSTRDPPPESSA